MPQRQGLLLEIKAFGYVPEIVMNTAEVTERLSLHPPVTHSLAKGECPVQVVQGFLVFIQLIINGTKVTQDICPLPQILQVLTYLKGPMKVLGCLLALA